MKKLDVYSKLDSAKIEKKNTQFTRTTKIFFVLDYPFSKPMRVDLESKDGFTTGMLVSEIQKAYKRMYDGATRVKTHKDSKIVNELWHSPEFGDAMHGMGELYLEVAMFDETTGQVHIAMGS